MDEIIPNLWIGDINSALQADSLKEKNIHSIVSVIRGTLSIHETFMKHQIDLDDSQDADVLSHLVSAISFMQKELDKGRGVLVHCQAGISRSATIVAAYLMYSQGMNLQEALDLIRQARPVADPNENFMSQLEIFHQASFKVSRHDKGIRMYYLDRVMKEIMNGDGTGPIQTDMLARHPDTPGPSRKAAPRRRIRCKMCRQELATREHMLDHGQLGPATPIEPLAASASPTTEDLPQVRFPIPSNEAYDSAVKLGQDLSDNLTISESKLRDSETSETQDSTQISTEAESGPLTSTPTPSKSYPVHPSALNHQLLTNPKLAALRQGIPLPPHLLNVRTNSTVTPADSPPILVNSKCSGYFVEPMKWMEPFLSKGELAGKIICPNKKCNAKLGNYDWAGVCCSCKEWVIPGFCIHRSRVDEVA
ncbi:protein-tyrosine phosphatase-like protein [Abortiporus biennis]|nr:protein-tyrosine phosphatase-like protein [Abortiporus biennis]